MNRMMKPALALAVAVGLAGPVAADEADEAFEALKAAAQDKAIEAAFRELAQTMYEWGYDAAIEATETCSGAGAADEQACIKRVWLEKLFASRDVAKDAHQALIDAVARYGSRMRIAAAAENERAHEGTIDALIDAFARYGSRMRNETREER